MSQGFTANGLVVGYRGRPVLRPVELALPTGAMIGILGPNGSGKTTFLKTLARILPPLSGRLLLDGRPLQDYAPAALARRLAVVLTDRVELDGATCFEVAAMGRAPHTGLFGILSDKDRAFTRRCLERCAAGYLADLPFSQVSAGEQQKVLLARGLAQDPEVLLLDEPTSHLDIQYKLELLAALRRLTLEEGKTVLCTLHEPDLAIKCCDVLLLVQEGCSGSPSVLRDWGPTDEVLSRGQVEQLYHLQPRQLDLLMGSVEFSPAAVGTRLYFLGQGEELLPLLRLAAARQVRLATGPLPPGSVVGRLARNLGAERAQEPAPEDWLCTAGPLTPAEQMALDEFRRHGRPVYSETSALRAALEANSSNCAK